MRESSESPVPAEKRGAFAPLTYFAINPEYRVPAALKLTPGNQVIQMSTSTGQKRQMRRVGSLEFTLKAQPLHAHRLRGRHRERHAAAVRAVRRSHQRDGDLSGRTLPGPRSHGNRVSTTSTSTARIIRSACSTPSYDCPIPPRENRLTTPIRAGEKLGAQGH